MTLLTLSVLAAVVGVALIAFLVMRFALKVMWKLAMVAVVLTVIVIGAGASYLYLEGSPLELPSLPALPNR